MQHWKWTLGHLWKSTDEHERASGCERVDDVRTLVGAPWNAFKSYLNVPKRADFARNVYRYASDAVQTALGNCGIDHELPKNPFPHPPSRRRETESPYSAEIKADTLDALRELRHETIQRIDRANAFADTGQDPIETLAAWEAADHDRFDTIWTPENCARLVRDHAMPDLLGKTAFENRYGIKRIRFLQKLFEAEPMRGSDHGATPTDFCGALYRVFLPIAADFASWPKELILKAGINQQPAFDFNRHDWYERVGPDRVVMFTRKTRAGGKIVDFGSDMGPDDPFGIVDTAIRLSEPVHKMVCRELDQLQSLAASEVTESVDRRIQELRALRNRVWLVMRRRPLDPTALTTSFPILGRLTNERLHARGLTEHDKPFRWSSRKARDSFAHEVWQKSGRFLPAVAEALHNTPPVAADYVNHPLSRRQDAMLLLQIWESMREDLAHLLKHGHRPEPARVENVPRPALAMTMFGPAREWLLSTAPDSLRALLETER